MQEDTIIHNGVAYTMNSPEALRQETAWKWINGNTIKMGANYNIDLKNNVISLDHYFGYEPIQFKDEDKLIFIALPYDLILHEKKYFWINNLSEKQFVEANTNITEIITREIYK